MSFAKLEELEVEEGIPSRYRDEERFTVETPHGPITVSVEPGCSLEKQKDKPVLLTYHDIATNHATCFGSFFALDECQIFKSIFCVVHIDAPGHEEGAEPLDPSRAHLTMEQLGDQVGYVVKRLGLHDKYNRIYGFGVGAGCSVLLKYATFDVNQARFAGMILVNGSGGKAAWREWIWYKMVTNTMWLQGMSSRARSAFLHRMFTSECIEDNEDLAEEYSATVGKMNPTNIQMFLDAHINRPDLSDDIDCISCFDVIQFAGGDNADFLYHVKELNKMFELGRSTFLSIDECRMLITEEGPHHMANPIKYWLAGKGYLLSALDMRANRHPNDDED
ncbi:NDRG-like protein [Diplonema papillatum]|nr:NDRG-like protein [Diplonema papillatum]